MKILCGYNVNIDSVYKICGAELSELLDSFESSEILDKIKNPPGRIETLSDFAAGLAYCMKNGYGEEWLVFGDSIFEFLKEHYFGKALVRMGGNAGIMANALSELGASLVVPNIAVPSKLQLSLFSRKNLYFPKNSEKPQVEKPQVSEETFLDRPPIHFVFDFSEGDSFFLVGNQVVVPRENRFIATCDQLNFKLFANPAFETYVLEHVAEMDGVLISGFHLLLETYPDGSSYEKYVGQAFTRLRTWKAKNKKLKTHLEFGHFTSRKIARTVFLNFSEISDSMGMNEDELAGFSDLHGIQPAGILKMEAEVVGKAALKLASIGKLKRLLVHTREFVLAVVALDSDLETEDIDIGRATGKTRSLTELEIGSLTELEIGSLTEPGTEPEIDSVAGFEADSVANSFSKSVYSGFSDSLRKEAFRELKALEFGIRAAGTYAATGKLEGKVFVESKSEELEESTFGKEQLSAFLSAFEGKPFLKGAFALREGYLLCMLPTLLSKAPVTTVGLGDTFTSGTFLRRLELDLQA